MRRGGGVSHSAGIPARPKGSQAHRHPCHGAGVPFSSLWVCGCVCGGLVAPGCKAEPLPQVEPNLVSQSAPRLLSKRGRAQGAQGGLWGGDGARRGPQQQPGAGQVRPSPSPAFRGPRRGKEGARGPLPYPRPAWRASPSPARPRVRAAAAAAAGKPARYDPAARRRQRPAWDPAGVLIKASWPAQPDAPVGKGGSPSWLALRCAARRLQVAGRGWESQPPPRWLELATGCAGGGGEGVRLDDLQGPFPTLVILARLPGFASRPTRAPLLESCVFGPLGCAQLGASARFLVPLDRARLNPNLVFPSSEEELFR